MKSISRAVALLILALAGPAAAKTMPLEQMTVADINAAFDAGTLTSQKLVSMSLARIAAYDLQGPAIQAVMHLNPKALETAKALDAERKAKGPRSPLHGVPVVLKDNFDTADMPTTGGSPLLEGWIPPRDAYVVQKLREAGAIIVAKLNMSEFAGSGQALGGRPKNPHDLARTPSGSSSGPGVAIAADFATIGLGTDTGGSIIGPATSNGIVGLKPTHGLLSRGGIIPLALTFDSGGPMTRSVYDTAVAMGIMTGVDPADPATRLSEGKFEKDYVKYLKTDALKGARIGFVRQSMKQDQDVDWVMEAALEMMKRQGATIVDVTFPAWFLAAKADIYTIIRWPEFGEQVAEYLKITGPQYPKTLKEMVERTRVMATTGEHDSVPNAGRWLLFQRELASGDTKGSTYVAMRDHGLPLMTATVQGIFTDNKLDAIVFPTSPTRPGLVARPPGGGGGERGPSLGSIGNLTGFPELTVPAGFTSDRLPVGLSFLGTAFSDARIMALGYAFEQASRGRRPPVNTPALAGELIRLPD